MGWVLARFMDVDEGEIVMSLTREGCWEDNSDFIFM